MAENMKMVTVELINDTIQAYETQFEQAAKQLEQLEQSYHMQRTALVNTLNQIKGAVDSMKVLVAATEAPATPPAPTQVPAQPMDVDALQALAQPTLFEK